MNSSLFSITRYLARPAYQAAKQCPSAMNQLALEKDYYIQMQEEEIARLSQNGQMSAEAEMNAELGITELAHWILVQLMANPRWPTQNLWPKTTQIWTRFLGHFTKNVPLGSPVSIKNQIQIRQLSKIKNHKRVLKLPRWFFVGGF